MKALVGIFAVISVLSTFSGSASAGQEERGLVVAPIPRRAGAIVVESCSGVIDTTARWATGTSVVDYRFSVRSSTWGMPFTLNSGHAAANLDIAFRVPSHPYWIHFASNALGGEQGVVPLGSLEAFVCLSTGAPTTFTYRAGG